MRVLQRTIRRNAGNKVENTTETEFQDAEIRLQLEEYKFEFQKFLEIRYKLEINLVSFLDQLVRVGIL